MVQLCQEYQERSASKKGLEERKKDARAQLDKHSKKTFGDYGESINSYLENFGVEFRLTGMKTSLKGGETPSSQYEIILKGHPEHSLKLGNDKTSTGMPRFKTALSSGDRSALALAFFLSLLDKKANLAQEIIVFDDPFTSFDRSRRACTQEFIEKFSKKAEQTIVLSHDPYFLELLRRSHNSNADIRILEILKIKDTSTIIECDLGKKTRSSDEKTLETLEIFYKEREGDLDAVANAIRLSLDSALKEKKSLVSIAEK